MMTSKKNLSEHAVSTHLRPTGNLMHNWNDWQVYCTISFSIRRDDRVFKLNHWWLMVSSDINNQHSIHSNMLVGKLQLHEPIQTQLMECMIHHSASNQHLINNNYSTSQNIVTNVYVLPAPSGWVLTVSLCSTLYDMWWNKDFSSSFIISWMSGPTQRMTRPHLCVDKLTTAQKEHSNCLKETV